MSAKCKNDNEDGWEDGEEEEGGEEMGEEGEEAPSVLSQLADTFSCEF